MFLLALALWFLPEAILNKLLPARWLMRTIKRNAPAFALAAGLAATAGSLFFSEIAGFEPCRLCWFQRIFMYPIALILVVGLLRRSRDAGAYAIALSIPGAIVSAYHYSLQRISYASYCSADAAVCSQSYLFHFGYISIPMMAFTAFGLIGLFSLISLRYQKGPEPEASGRNKSKFQYS